LLILTGCGERNRDADAGEFATILCHTYSSDGVVPVVTAWDVPDSECSGPHILEEVDDSGRVSRLRFMRDDSLAVVGNVFPSVMRFEYREDAIVVDAFDAAGNAAGYGPARSIYHLSAGDLVACEDEVQVANRSAPVVQRTEGPRGCGFVAEYAYSQARLNGRLPVARGYSLEEMMPPAVAGSSSSPLGRVNPGQYCHLVEYTASSRKVVAWSVHSEDCVGDHGIETVDDSGRVASLRFYEGDRPYSGLFYIPAEVRYSYGPGRIVAEIIGEGAQDAGDLPQRTTYYHTGATLDSCRHVYPGATRRPFETARCSSVESYTMSRAGAAGVHPRGARPQGIYLPPAHHRLVRAGEFVAW
jgi:hypothetical protein